MDRLHRVLNAEIPGTALDEDAHAASCVTCRERIAAAKLVMACVTSAEPVPTRTDFTESIVAAVLADRQIERRIRFRQRTYAVGGLAIAAAVTVALWLGGFGKSRPNAQSSNPEMANVQPAPTVNPNPVTPVPAAPARPVKLGEEFAKAEHALVNSSKPLTDPASVAPKVLVRLTDVLTRPAEPAPEFEPARKSLLELPDAARTGLEPVTSTTQKAFARLLHDVGAVR